MLINILGISGSGKTTLKKWLSCEYPSRYFELVTHTTRLKRKGESKNDYHFIKKEEFNKKKLILKRGLSDGFLYGVDPNDLCLNDNRVMLTSFNTKGILGLEKLQVKIIVFFLNISVEVCRQRLLSRGDIPDVIKKRLQSDLKSLDLSQIKSKIYVLEKETVSENGKKIHAIL